ncbi:S1 family peptidase [Spongiactinospora sp. TRM90649]|uniref:S1 family peptidase n=1 Tax=Spongiactinospora sp. TRM90649 TaxID=3031114 RepID=UPI0023F96F35|nr:S1 family peptidase [Spongiactinospora sp. TRM90649]MDF5755149.1 S1 family peptidase [Spongiactinospora sp. TRM90649]
MHRNRSLIAGVALATGALLITAAPVQAKPGAQPPPGVVEAMRRDLGLSAAGASARLAAEERARDIAPVLRDRLASRYGGSWVTPQGDLVVATTDATGVAAVTSAGARAKVVARALPELDAIKSALDEAGAGRAEIRGWHVDVVTNSVVVQAADRASGEALVRESGVDPSAVRVEVTAERPVPYVTDVAGGDVVRIGSSSRCVIGFMVKRGKRDGFVTAGHCGKKGDLVYPLSGNIPIGVVQAASFPGNDHLWVALNPGWRAIAAVRGGGRFEIITGSAESVVGSTVCTTGLAGWRCGTVQQRNASVTYPSGTVSGLTRTSVCSEPGDSGAPFISGTQAQGVTSGGSGNCSTGGTTYFQPINGALAAYGLTLLVLKIVPPTIPPTP